MSKKPKLVDLPGLGPKMEEKLVEAGIKTVLNLSRADADKLAAKVDGLSEAGAAKLIETAQEALGAPEPKKPAKEVKPKKVEPKPVKPKPKKAEPAKPKAKEEKPKKAEPKPKTEKKPAKKKAPESTARETRVDMRLLRIAKKMRRRQPRFRAEGAHRWIRVSDSWRKLRGIDSATREKRKGRIAMVSSGYRKPRAVRGLHPSLYQEVMVYRPADLEGLDPDIHAVRIGGSVGLRKRQEIIKRAETMLLKILNPGVPEVLEEDELFSELDDLEVD
ncbi:MAG: 50S ribosomal protein L32e [Candidatus Thorarchaeota archaeon]